jgi:PAS domain S-box-containing protein
MTTPMGIWLGGGIGWIAMVAIAFALHRSDRSLPWKWLTVAALLHTLQAWLGLYGATHAFRSPMGTVGGVLGAAASIALLEFARQGMHASGLARFPRGVLIPLAGLSIVGAMIGWPWPVDASGSALGLLAAAGVTAVCQRTARSKPERARAGLQIAGWVLLLQAIACGLGAPGSPIVVTHTIAEILTLASAIALLGYALWDADVASGRGPAYVRTVILAAAVLMAGLTIVLADALIQRRLENATGPFASWQLVPIGTGLLLSAVIFGLLTAWRSTLEWVKRIHRQDADLLGPIVEATRDGLLVVDEANEVVFRNSRFVAMWNLPQAQLEQRDADQLWPALLEQLVDPEGFRATLRQAARSQGEHRDVVRFRDGHVFQVYSCPMPSESEIVGRAWSFKDITGLTSAEVERRNQQIRLQREADALARLTRRRLSQSGDLEAALREITKTGADTLALEHVSAWLLDAEGTQLQCADAYERSSNEHASGATDNADDFPHFLAALEAEGRTLAIEDPEGDPRVSEVRAAHLADRHIGALMVAPIRLDGEMVGFVMCLHSGSARHWAADEEHFAASLADHAAQAVERDEHRLTEQALRRNQELQQLLVDTAASAVLLADGSGRVASVNEALSTTTGFLPEELIGRSHTVISSEECGEDCVLRHPEDLSAQVTRHPCRILDREGRTHSVLLNRAPVLDSTGTLVGLVVSFVDVSDALQARSQLDELMRETAAVREDASTAQTRFETLNAELETARQAREAFEQQAHVAQATASQAEEQVESLTRELAQARDAQQAAEQRATLVAQQLEEKAAGLNVARTERDVEKQQAIQLAADLAESQTALERAQQELARSRDELSLIQMELADARREGSTWSDQLAQLTSASAQLEAERERASQSTAEFGRRITQLEQALAHAQAGWETASADAAAATDRLAKLLGEHRDAQSDLAQARAELERVRDEAQSGHGEIKALMERDRLADAEREALHSETEAARERFAAASRELEETRGSLEAVRSELDVARGIAEALRADLQTMQVARDESVAQVGDLKERVTRLAVELQETRLELDRSVRAHEAKPAPKPAERGVAKPQAAAEPSPPLLHIARPGERKLSREPVADADASLTAQQGPFDAEALLQSVNADRQLAAGRARAFQKGSAWMVACVRQALERKDPRALIGAARSLRAALGDVAAVEAQRLAGELEEMGRRKDLSQAPKAMRALESEIERVRAALASFSRAA